MAPKATNTKPNTADTVSPTPAAVEVPKATTIVAIDGTDYDMALPVDIIRLADILGVMDDKQRAAYTIMQANDMLDTFASMAAKALESSVKKAIKERLKPDYVARWRATTVKKADGTDTTIADYEASVKAMIAKLNDALDMFNKANEDAKIGTYGLSGGDSKSRGARTINDRNYDRLGAALLDAGIEGIHYVARNWLWPLRPAVTSSGEASAEFQYTGATIGTHKIRNRRKELVDKASILVSGKWYPIGLLNQANTELCEFNGWESGTIETVSAPNSWIACKVKVGDKLVTLEAWYDEHIANDEDGAE